MCHVDHISSTVYQMQPITVSAWFLVARANIIVQRVIEHGFQAHYQSECLHVYHLQGRHVPRVGRAHNIIRDPLNWTHYMNLFDMCLFCLALAVLTFVLEFWATGRLAAIMWSIIE